MYLWAPHKIVFGFFFGALVVVTMFGSRCSEAEACTYQVHISSLFFSEACFRSSCLAFFTERRSLVRLFASDRTCPRSKRELDADMENTEIN